MDITSIETIQFKLSRMKYEYLLIFILSVTASIYFYDQINWPNYIILFAIIDVAGYIPGIIWSLAKKTHPTPLFFYRAYNFTHSIAFAAMLAATYFFIFNEIYSTLALAAHLSGDRGVLGNFFKSHKEKFI